MQDPKKIEAYLSKTFPELVKQAKKLGAQIYFVDEAAIHSEGLRGVQKAIHRLLEIAVDALGSV